MALDALELGRWIDAVAVSSQLLLVVVSRLGTLGLPMVVVPVPVAVQSLVLVGAVADWVLRVLADWCGCWQWWLHWDGGVRQAL